MEYISERITIDERICNGKPTIRGSRITVQSILDFLSSGDTSEEILKQFPKLEEEDIKESLRFAANLMGRNYSIKPVA
jgi:uncharacterized protein (DUF433 family)